jgi:eukaryotic-like serine/threonine-protein kinase
VVVSNVYHHLIMIHEAALPWQPSEPHISQSEEADKTSGQENVPPEYEPAVPSLFAKDGTTMHLVPGGQVKLPAYVGAEGGKLVEVSSFYLDETEVTNYKYVEFLNQVLSRVKVKEGIVRGDGQPWLVLGPVFGGYEPIIFRNGRFSVPDAGAASRPVVKVTGYGAAAYAAFYGERLPTEVEWLRAASETEDLSKQRPKSGDEPALSTADLEKEMEPWTGAFKQGAGVGDASSKESRSATRRDRQGFASSENWGSSTVPYPVLDFHPNVDGIRGLMRNVSEWGMRFVLSPSARPQFVVLGGVKGTMLAGSTPFPGIAQDPSMGFEDVGFRCAKSVEESHTK